MLKPLNKEKVNKKSMWEYLTSEVMWHKNCRRQVLHLTYQPSRFNKFGNDTNGYNINSNNNDSSNINEVIRAVLNFLFFYEKISHAPKSTKSTKKHKKHKNATKQKHKNANKRTKIKNVLKKYLRGKSHLLAYLRFCACEEKNRKVSTMEMLVPLN